MSNLTEQDVIELAMLDMIQEMARDTPPFLEYCPPTQRCPTAILTLDGEDSEDV